MDFRVVGRSSRDLGIVISRLTIVEIAPGISSNPLYRIKDLKNILVVISFIAVMNFSKETNANQSTLRFLHGFHLLKI